MVGVNLLNGGLDPWVPEWAWLIGQSVVGHMESLVLISCSAVVLKETRSGLIALIFQINVDTITWLLTLEIPRYVDRSKHTRRGSCQPA